MTFIFHSSNSIRRPEIWWIWWIQTGRTKESAPNKMSHHVHIHIFYARNNFAHIRHVIVEYISGDVWHDQMVLTILHYFTHWPIFAIRLVSRIFHSNVQRICVCVNNHVDGFLFRRMQLLHWGLFQSDQAYVHADRWAYSPGQRSLNYRIKYIWSHYFSQQDYWNLWYCGWNLQLRHIFPLDL